MGFIPTYIFENVSLTGDRVKNQFIGNIRHSPATEWSRKVNEIAEERKRFNAQWPRQYFPHKSVWFSSCSRSRWKSPSWGKNDNIPIRTRLPLLKEKFPRSAASERPTFCASALFAKQKTINRITPPRNLTRNPSLDMGNISVDLKGLDACTPPFLKGLLCAPRWCLSLAFGHFCIVVTFFCTQTCCKERISFPYKIGHF